MRIKNTDKDFYNILGPVFGSRKIQRVTKDRFYDDDEKEWIIQVGKDKKVIYAISVVGNTIKNIYSEDPEAMSIALKNLYGEVLYGIVPAVYKNVYISAGYSVQECNMVNYVKIIGGKHERPDH